MRGCRVCGRAVRRGMVGGRVRRERGHTGAQGPVLCKCPGSCSVAVRIKPAKPGLQCCRSCEGAAPTVELT